MIHFAADQRAAVSVAAQHPEVQTAAQTSLATWFQVAALLQGTSKFTLGGKLFLVLCSTVPIVNPNTPKNLFSIDTLLTKKYTTLGPLS